MLNYNPKENPVKIKCRGHKEVSLESLKIFQGKLKSLSEESRDKLVTSILEKGFIAPIFIWEDKGETKLLDGTQRTKTLIWLQENGWNIPEIPVAVIEAETEEEAKAVVLAISSQYGDFDTGVLADWVDEIGEENSDMFRFFTNLGEVAYDDGEMYYLNVDPIGEEDEPEEQENPYTGKIEAPIYTPKMENPPAIEELFDREKTIKLTEEIKAAGITDKALEQFLLNAAQRHTVFTYDKIAEYYSHAPAKIQDLMEKSALVIIDFDKAIENGFVKLSEDLARVYVKGQQDDEK